jgi:transcriptional regulator with XRE-family HTH domain
MIDSKKLKEIRTSNGFDQLQFAEKLGVSRQYISQMERGAKEVSYKFEAKLKQLGLIPEPKSEEDFCINWLQKELDLTEIEVKSLIDNIKDDKVPYLLLGRARTGDKKAAELLKHMFTQ